MKVQQREQLPVVKVGKGGRGFVVEIGREERVVITAAHCLPHLPPSQPFAHTNERTYRELLAKLGSEPTVVAECLFADPVADIAVLGCPERERLRDPANEYEALVMGVTPLSIADAPERGREKLLIGDETFNSSTPGRGPALLLSLKGEWIECTVERAGAAWLSVEEPLVDSGMSGSPILAADGGAIGLVPPATSTRS